MSSFYLNINFTRTHHHYFTKCIILMILFVLVASQLGWAQDNARNRRPRITGQKSITINEDQSYTINMTDVSVEDRDPSDWFYPNGFSMTLYEGANYTISDKTVIPNANFYGTLTIPITVNDGEDNSNPFDFKITVNPVNDAPVITGQNAASSNEDTPFTITLGNLQISDPDDTQFTIVVLEGTNYTFSGNVISPTTNFFGTLTIPLKVVDSQSAESQVFNFQLTINPVNDPPVITGQQSITGASGTPLTLQLSHLIVSDPDDTYPNGFSLSVQPGDNYAVSGTQITPAASFVGELSVTVSVSDGKAQSNAYPLKINIQRGNGKPIITSQTPVIINEDQSFTFTLAYLKVSDNDSNYPQGFTFKLNPGSNYTISNNNVIVPSTNYSGNLFVDVTVSDGTNTSDPYTFLITVRPVNDPPLIKLERQDSIYIKPGTGLVTIFEDINITDPDNDSLTIAEIGFTEDTYEPSFDLLTFTNTQKIRGVFDAQNGILALIGKASLAEYIVAFKTIQVSFAEQLNTSQKTIYAIVNDGLSNSNRVIRPIKLTDEVRLDLEIPSGFTPNGDQVNDTWIIRPLTAGIPFDDTTIRVYTKAGVLVFESNGFDKAWDGSFNGSMLPADVYFYVIDINSTENKSSVKGLVTILR